MADYAKLRTTAERLIKSNGKAVTITHIEEGEYDPSSGVTTTTTTISGYGVLLNYSNTEIDGTAILASDKKMIYSGEEPTQGDKYGFYRIVSVSPLDPDETCAIIYTLQLRK